MPSAVPACWMVSLSAEPTPAFSAGISLISAPTAAGIARPAPRPSRPSATAGIVKPVSASTVLSRTNEPAIRAMPTRTSGRWPVFALSPAPAPLPISAATAIGTKAVPALTGE